MERLSRYCHRGLSSGGSRRFSRRDRHGGNHLPAGEGWCWVRAWGSRAPGVSLSRSQPRGFTGSAPASARPRGLCRGCRRPGPTHPGRGRWRRQRPARPSLGPARRAQRAGARAGSWFGQEAAASRSLALGLLGPPWDPRALAAPTCPGSALGAAASTTIWRPHGLTASPAQVGQSSSSGRFRNCAGGYAASSSLPFLLRTPRGIWVGE